MTILKKRILSIAKSLYEKMNLLEDEDFELDSLCHIFIIVAELFEKKNKATRVNFKRNGKFQEK